MAFWLLFHEPGIWHPTILYHRQNFYSQPTLPGQDRTFCQQCLSCHITRLRRNELIQHAWDDKLARSLLTKAHKGRRRRLKNFMPKGVSKRAYHAQRFCDFVRPGNTSILLSTCRGFCMRIYNRRPVILLEQSLLV